LSSEVAFHTRLRRSVGMFGSSQVMTNGPFLFVTVTWSHNASD
jgi:hypothetical protein